MNFCFAADNLMLASLQQSISLSFQNEWEREYGKNSKYKKNNIGLQIGR